MNDRRSPLVALVALAVLGIAGCGTSYVVPPSDPTLLAHPQPAGEVRGAVIDALTLRRYTAESEGPGKITARLDRGGASLRVVIEFDEQHYRVSVVAFGGYKTEPAPNGTQIPEERLSKELHALRKSIDMQLKKPAKERAAAERQERDYQILLAQQRTAQAQAEAQAQQQQGQGGGGPTFVIPVAVPPINMPTLDAHSSTTTGSQSITCCINGALYNCPSQDAFQQCMGTNPGACTSAGRCK